MHETYLNNKIYYITIKFTILQHHTSGKTSTPEAHNRGMDTHTARCYNTHIDTGLTQQPPELNCTLKKTQTHEIVLKQFIHIQRTT